MEVGDGEIIDRSANGIAELAALTRIRDLGERHSRDQHWNAAAMYTLYTTVLVERLPITTPDRVLVMHPLDRSG